VNVRGCLILGVDLIKNSGKGVFVSFISTIVMMLVLAMIMSFMDLSTKSLYVGYVVVTCISIVFGSIYSAKRNGSKGWLVGLLVGILYYILIGIISSIATGSMALGLFDFYRFIFAVAIGLLSGMLGINL